MIKEALLQLNNKLSNNIKWAVFGGVAVVIHKKNLYRDFEDIDIVIENDKNKITNLLSSYEVCFKTRNGRERGYFTIDNQKIELLFLTGENEFDLADGKFKFNEIREEEFDGIKLPVIDLQSLYCAKLRHKQSLEQQEEKYKTKLENTNKDLDILKKLIDI